MNATTRDLLVPTLAAWGGRFEIFETAAFSERSEMAELLAALAEAYPTIDADRLSRATLAVSFYADAIVVSDDIIDYTANDPSWARKVPAVGAHFIQACVIWSELFGAPHWFWDAMRDYHAEYLTTMRLEGDIAAGRVTWAACDEAVCAAIVCGKNGPIRVLAATAAALADDVALLAELEALALGYFAASQMLDDVADWREDVRDGNISLLLRRVCDRRPSVDELAAIGARMFAGGHVDAVLGRAREELGGLIERARALQLTRLTALLQRRFVQIDELASALREDVAAQLRRKRDCLSTQTAHG